MTANLPEPRTQSYAGFEVQFYTPTPDGWVELPTDDIGIIFDGSSATVKRPAGRRILLLQGESRVVGMAAWLPDPGEPLPLNHSKRTPEVVGLLVGSVERRATKKARTDGRARRAEAQKGPHTSLS